MTRMSKQSKDRSVSPKRPRGPAKKTGPKKDKLSKGYKEHPNAIEGDFAAKAFVPKIK